MLLRLHRMFLHAPLAVVRAVARSLRRTQPQRGRRGAALHEREPAPRAQACRARCRRCVTAGRAHDLQQVFDRAERALLRRRACACRSPGAAAAGARGAAGSPSAATTPCWPSSASIPCSTAATCRVYFLESVVYHEMLHHHMGGVPDRGGPHRLPLARLPRGGGALSRGTGRRWPGRRRTCRSCCAPARSSTASARPQSRRRAPRAGVARPRCATSGACCPTCGATAGALPASACSACWPPPRFSVASPWVLRHAVDDLTLAVTRDKLVALRRRSSWALVLVEGVFRYQMRMILIGISREIEYELRNDLFAHLTRLAAALLPAPPHRRPHEPRHQRPLRGAHGAGPRDHVHGQHASPPSWARIALMLTISPRLLRALAGAAAASSPSLVRYFGRRIHDRFEAVQAQLSEHQRARAGEPLGRARGARLRAGAARAGALRRPPTRSTCGATARLIRMFGSLYPGHPAPDGPGRGAACSGWAGAWWCAGAITLGEFVAFGAYLAMLHWPMIALGWVVNLFERGEASMGRIARDPGRAARDRATTAPRAGPAASAATCEFRGLTFAYDGRPGAARHDLDVPAGTTVAIVGPTGSGKSTLVSLIPRLFEAPPGTRARGRPRRAHAARSRTLRGAVGFVPQETFLFSDTVRENVAFGLPRRRRRPRAWTWAAGGGAARQGRGATSRRASTPSSASAGITLSGGQKQRTALARALAADPRILVLDDALSSVDTYTEEEILRGLRGRDGHAHHLPGLPPRLHREGRRPDRGAAGRPHRGARHATTSWWRRGGFYADLHRRQLLEEEMEQTA